MEPILKNAYLCELEAHQFYCAAAACCRYWGLNKLAARFQADATDEAAHAALVLDRYMQITHSLISDPFELSESMRALPLKDMKAGLRVILEQVAIIESGVARVYRDVRASDRTGATNDAETVQLAEAMIIESEQSAVWANQQLKLVEAIGMSDYLAQNI